MFVKTMGSYPKVMEKIGGQRERRRSKCNFTKKQYGNRVGGGGGMSILPSLTGLLYSWFVSKILFATTTFTLAP